MSLAAYYEQHYGERSEVRRLKEKLAAAHEYHAQRLAAMGRELEQWRARALGAEISPHALATLSQLHC